MKTKSWLLSSLILGLSSLQGCASMEQNKAGETQPAEKAQLAEIAVPASPKAAEKTAVPVANPAPEQPIAKVLPKKGAAHLDRYAVVAGDTLAIIAARPEVYGDAQLWPLLYVANNSQIGPRGLIFPGQVLFINRNFTPADVKALTGRSRSLKHIASVAKHDQAKNPGAPVAADKASTPKAAPVEVKAPENAAAKPKEDIKAAAVETKPQETAATKPKDEIKSADYLSAARRAFAAGDVPWSVHYYNAYLAEKNQDANAWGELGNVYYFDGRLPDSAQAYFNAANVLIDHGHTARALKLMPAIEEGNPGLAEAIYLRLTTVKR